MKTPPRPTIWCYLFHSWFYWKTLIIGGVTFYSCEKCHRDWIGKPKKPL